MPVSLMLSVINMLDVHKRGRLWIRAVWRPMVTCKYYTITIKCVIFDTCVTIDTRRSLRYGLLITPVPALLCYWRNLVVHITCVHETHRTRTLLYHVLFVVGRNRFFTRHVLLALSSPPTTSNNRNPEQSILGEGRDRWIRRLYWVYDRGLYPSLWRVACVGIQD